MGQIKLFLKNNWKILLLLFIITTFCYSKYATFKLAKAVERVVDNNEFINYTSEEYINFFEQNGFEVNSTNENNEILIIGEKDNQVISDEYDYSIEGQKCIRFDNIYESYLPLIEGINSDNTFDQIKRKLHLNPFVTMYNFIITRKYGVNVADNHIMITDGADDSNYAYYILGFNDKGNMDTIIIYCLGLDY